jgi:hypothetical protein
MSMDISIWSRSPPDLPLALPQADGWSRNEYKSNVYYTFEGDGWLINVGFEHRSSEGKAIPDATATCGTYVSLEPIGASAAGYEFLEKVVRTLSKTCDGLWEHPGDGRFYRHDQGPF